MIVYGDPSYQATLDLLSERLRSHLGRLHPNPSLDDLRSTLIEAGQMEQAVHDALGDEEAARCEEVTSGLARAFVRQWMGQEPGDLPLPDGLPFGEASMTVKVPEGFAFYGLYPEGYVVAAQRWASSVHPTEPLAVIGIRSIGTTLSAVVAATLEAEGVPVRRFTVRPTGHPFQRKVKIEPSVLGRAKWVLVVDEGPGQSGSSMASVAEAVHEVGIPRDRIVFFPGHGGDPGDQASEAVKAWWASTPRFATPTEELRWGGRTLEETLADATGNVSYVWELTGGEWRELVFSDFIEWQSIAAPFERRKILICRKDGSEELWKFTGLGESLGSTLLGFVARKWFDGSPLRRSDATPEILAQLGRHITTVSLPPLNLEESRHASERLENLLYWNTLESPGPTVRLNAPEIENLPSAGDGRLAPQEWRENAGDTIEKIERNGPSIDHTAVGRQPIVWDIAGAMIEWELDETTALPLLAELPVVNAEALRFYCLAYAAFRMGMCAMCAGMSDASEAARLRKDEAFYRNAILRLV